MKPPPFCDDCRLLVAQCHCREMRDAGNDMKISVPKYASTPEPDAPFESFLYEGKKREVDQ